MSRNVLALVIATMLCVTILIATSILDDSDPPPRHCTETEFFADNC